MNKLLDARLTELKKDFAKLDKFDGTKPDRRIPKKFGRIRNGKLSTIAKLNKDIKAIIDKPIRMSSAEKS